MQLASHAPRLHALDARRGAMLLLGIVLHSVISFTVARMGAAILYSRRGIVDTLRHRSVRIALPLLVGWVVRTPLVKPGFVLGMSGGDWSAVAAIFASVGSMSLDSFSSMHLWYLYALMLFPFLSLRLSCNHRRNHYRIRGLTPDARLAPVL